MKFQLCIYRYQKTVKLQSFVYFKKMFFIEKSVTMKLKCKMLIKQLNVLH